MTSETPKFRREFSEERLNQFIKEITVMVQNEGAHPLIVQLRKASLELKHCYAVIDAAAEMAETVYGMVSSDEKDIFTCQVVSKSFLEKLK